MSEPYGVKLSCADFTFPLLPHKHVFKLLRFLEIDAVDLGVFAGQAHLHPQDLQRNPEGAAKHLRRVVSGNGLVVSDVFLQTGENPAHQAANDPNPAVRQELRDTFRTVVAFTNALGCTHITGLPGVRHNGVSDTDSFQRAVEEAAWRAQEASKAGIQYAIEAHMGSVCPDPESTLSLLNRSEGLRLTLDYTHFVAAGIPNEAVHPLLPWASHFHVRSAKPGQLQTVMQENTVDHEAILHWTETSQYKGFVCVEYAWVEWMGCNRTDNVSETILMREYIRNRVGPPKDTHAVEPIPPPDSVPKSALLISTKAH